MPSFPYKLIDLTHALSSATPTWDGSCGFEQHVICDYDLQATYKFRVHKLSMNEGIGTHMDAPAHCFPGAPTIDQLQLSNLVAPCAVIDISAAAHERSSASIQDIKNFEKEHGKIQPGTFVIMKTGWEKHWANPQSYRNNGLFPSIAGETAEFLLERNISGIGIDTLSPDREEDGFSTHKHILGARKIIVENAANLNALKPHGNLIMIAPMKIKNGTEAPIRLIAFAEHGP